MIRLVRPLAALLLLAAAAPAPAYVRETTTPGRPATGVCLWWRAREVTYRVNATSASTAPCGSAARAADAAALGLARWSGATRAGETAACTDFRFVPGGPTTKTALGNDGVNLVVFRSGHCDDVVGTDPCARTPGACAAKFNCWEHDVGTIGLTTTSFDAETGELLDADLELNGWDGLTPPLGYWFTCEDEAAPGCGANGEAGCNEVDVQAVVAHEAGHMLGLDHVCSSLFPAPYDACPAGLPVMRPTVGSVSQRALAADDVAGVCTIYPAGGATLTCLAGGEVPPKPSEGGGGCSTGGAAGIGGLLVTALSAWRGRRRVRHGPSRERAGDRYAPGGR